MSTPSTSLSTRVDASTKAKLLERAGELGVSPSLLLKQIVEGYLGGKSPESGRQSAGLNDSLTKLLEAAKGIGTYRVRRCKYNVRGICHAWAWEEKPETSVSVAQCEDKTCWASGKYHVEAHPERCAICHIFKQAE